MIVWVNSIKSPSKKIICCCPSLKPSQPDSSKKVQTFVSLRQKQNYPKFIISDEGMTCKTHGRSFEHTVDPPYLNFGYLK